jgi:hypothetical protein
MEKQEQNRSTGNETALCEVEGGMMEGVNFFEKKIKIKIF